MVINYSLESINNYSKEFQEIKQAFYSLPDNDPYKEELYKNILNMYNFIDENNQDNKPKFRLLNSLESGKIELEQLGYTSTKIQEIYSSAYSSKIGGQTNRRGISELVKEQSSIVVFLKAGSFIIEIDSIGSEEKKVEIDILEQNIDKFKLVNELMESISLIVNDEDVISFLSKYGHKALLNTQKWFKELSKDNIEFEYINKNNNIINKFTKDKVDEIYKVITEMKEIETSSDFVVKGILVGVINDNKKIIFKDSNKEKFTVQVLDDSLKGIKITTNEYYELKVEKKETKSLEKIKVDYLIDTIYNTSLQER